MPKGRTPSINHRCCWQSSREDKGCTRWARYRNAKLDLWLCFNHRNWVPGVKAGPVPQENQAFKIQRSYKKRNFIGNLDVCFCVTREAVACRRFPTKRLPDGRRLCDRHFIVWQKSDELERQTMSNMAVDNMMARRVKLLRFAQVPDRRVVNMPDEREQYEELDKRADATDDFTIKFKEAPKNIDVRNLTGKHRSAFFGIDIDYYTPEFKYDYMYMLMQAIRRSEAQINIYFQQLQRIENEEQELMQTIREGTMVGEKGIMEFKNTEVRKAIPIELKLRLMDNLTKAEAQYSKLLKQLQELPLVALMVLRKMGVKWDREASMMVLDKIEKSEGQILSDFGAIPQAITPTDLPLEKQIELVQADPAMAAKLKNIAQDDDW